mmetsp:Transcript_47522/g.74240  ORF Transcript_47522/g.74240 Transcript_47522/m.74240 type:complete len:92 (+) Transcript_47522:519-794(+)
MFKESQNCRVPHMNVDRLRDELHQAGVIGQHGFKSDQELFAWLLEANEKWREGGEELWMGDKPSAARMKAATKAADHGFFLGMGWGWLRDD